MLLKLEMFSNLNYFFNSFLHLFNSYSLTSIHSINYKKIKLKFNSLVMKRLNYIYININKLLNKQNKVLGVIYSSYSNDIDIKISPIFLNKTKTKMT